MTLLNFRRVGTGVLWSAAALLVSCESLRFGRPAEALVIRTPGSWVAVSSGTDAKISSAWLADLGDAALSGTVEEALANNRDLKVAAARFREARQASMISRARSLPSLGLSGSAGVSDASGAGSTESYGLNLAAAWEPDLWGRLRDLNRAAAAGEIAALEDFRGARLSLAANAAKAWCNLISSEQEVALAQVTLESFQSNLRIIERNYVGTGEGALDIQFGRTNVSSAQRALEQRRQAREEAARALEVLLGRYPAGELVASQDLPSLRGVVPAGIPADFLERRPDLAAVRASLFATARRADAARKALLPSFSITAAGGSSNARLADLLDAERLFTSIAGRFSQVISEGGAVSAEAQAALDRNDAALNAYAQAALIAFREVESALSADRSLAAQETFLASELEQAALAERQAERDYSEGVNANILSVLEAQRRANNARAGMIRLRNQRLQNRIDLHLALGGDFQTPAAR
jgi:NodT family efflux transporter outer membrane factor (OMF) lipoprotein